MLGSGVQILNSKSKEVDEVEYVEMETPLLQISNSCVFPDFLRRTQDTSPSADSRLQTPDSRLQTPDSRPALIFTGVRICIKQSHQSQN